MDQPKIKRKSSAKKLRKEILRIEGGSIIEYLMTNMVTQAEMLPKLVEILPQKEVEESLTYSHEGEEFVYVLEGILTLKVENEVYDLYPGDCAHYLSTRAHNWSNQTNKVVKFITINTPNLFKEIRRDDMKEPTIVNIQKYSVHDGDGIRTTVFFKGCLLNCWWCHNPESQKYTPELMFTKEKCTGCGYCEKACTHDAITVESDGIAHTDPSKCVLCADCLDYCVQNNREIVGKTYSIKELMKIINKDAHFYEESGGGVTLSGGEVMTQDMEYLEELCKCIKRKRL